MIAPKMLIRLPACHCCTVAYCLLSPASREVMAPSHSLGLPQPALVAVVGMVVMMGMVWGSGCWQ